MSAARRTAPFVLAIALFLLLVASAWIGFIGSDDVTYARGAYGWLEQFPYVGGHGTIRYTITLPIALAFRTLGENEYAMVLPSLLYTVGFLVLAIRFMRRADGDASALAAAILFITSPLFVIQGSIANVDMIELFFVFASFACWWHAAFAGGRTRWLIGAGMLAGLAFLTRETAIFIASFYAALFLAAYRLPRARYLWIAAGFLAVWGLEVAYLTIMTGDPFYRFQISMHHDATIDRSIDLAGNVIVHPLVDPLLVLLINQEFMLLYWLAIPLSVWLCFGRNLARERQDLARLLALLGLSWFVCVAAVQNLLPLNPRYFTVTTATAILLTGLGIAELGARRHRLTMTLVVGLVAVNLVGIIVENKSPMFGERKLVAFARSHPRATVTTDPMTRHRADLLLRWAGARERVRAEPPVVGALHFYNPAYAVRPNARMTASDAPRYQPQGDWVEVVRFTRPEPIAATLVDSAGLRAYVPAALWCKLRQCDPGVAFYMVSTRGRPSTIAYNRLTAVPHVAAAPIPAVSVLAQGPVADGREGHRL